MYFVGSRLLLNACNSRATAGRPYNWCAGGNTPVSCVYHDQLYLRGGKIFAALR